MCSWETIRFSSLRGSPRSGLLAVAGQVEAGETASGLCGGAGNLYNEERDALAARALVVEVRRGPWARPVHAVELEQGVAEVPYSVDPGPAALLPHVMFDPRSLLGDQHVGG